MTRLAHALERGTAGGDLIAAAVARSLPASAASAPGRRPRREPFDRRRASGRHRRSPWALRPADRRALLECLLLAALLHVLLVAVIGNAPGGSARPGSGVAGSLNVTLRGYDRVAGAPVPAPPARAVGPTGSATQPRHGGAVRAPETAPRPDDGPGAARLGTWTPAPEAAMPSQPAVGEAKPPVTALPTPVSPPPASTLVPPPPAPPLAEQSEAPITAPAPAPEAVAPSEPAPRAAVPEPTAPAVATAVPAAPAIASPAELPPVVPPPPPLPSPPVAAPTLAAPVPPPAPPAATTPMPVPAPTVTPPAAAVTTPAPAATPPPTSAAAPTVPPLTPRAAPTVAPIGTPGLTPGGPDAGPQRGHDLATPPSAAASAPPPPLNLQLTRPRGGELSGRVAPGAFPLLPRPPERPSKLATDIENAARPDCRTAHAGMGLLAVVPLAANAATDSGCKW